MCEVEPRRGHNQHMLELCVVIMNHVRENGVMDTARLVR